MNIFQIPHTASKFPETFISVIDASGSMRPFWSTLAKYFNRHVPKKNSITITFDTTPYLISDNILSEDIFKHGGGGTNITAAFELMDKKIEELDKKQPLTILFVSDGQDNNIDSLELRLKRLKGNQGRTVTFICLGIQSQFPTFISMHLRELYHNGLSSIPALYLIEYYSDMALYNKFETMKEHFSHKKLMKVDPPVSVVPWLPPQSEVHEDTWILTNETKLKIDGKEYEINNSHMKIEHILEVFRTYVQELQMLSLTKNPNIKEYAQKALTQMKLLMNEFNEKEKLDINLWIEDSHLLKANFYDRCRLQKLRHNQFRIKAFLENITSLTKGEEVKEMNEWEAAKRLGVGTITGCYQQKVLNLKGFTVEMYKEIRHDFIKLFRKLKIEKETEQENSIITKQTQKDVFLEEGFEKALELCESQFDLAETLPLIGIAVQLKRYSGSNTDPWLIGVKLINNKNIGIDSVALYHNKFKLALPNQIIEKEKTPSGNGQEFYNGLLPLFGSKEEDVLDIAQHPLYHILINFVTTENLDILLESSYLALLSNSAIYLLTQPKTEWSMTLFKRIIMSTLLVYGKNKSFLQYCDSLRVEPEKNIKYDQTNIEGCSDLSRPLIHLICMHQLGKISKEELFNVLQHCFIWYFGRLVESKKHLENLKVIGDKIINKVKENIVADFNKFNTLKDLWRDVDNRLKNISNEISFCPVTINATRLEKQEDKISFKTLNTLFEYFIGNMPHEDDYLFWLYCAIHFPGKKLTECERDTEKIRQYFFNLLKKDLMRPNASAVYATLKDSFMRKFKEEHMYLIPMSFGELFEYCNATGEDISKYEYVRSNNLINNACMCKKCPFYLKIQPDLNKHLSAWAEKCPRAFHKTVKRNTDKSPEIVLDKVLSGELAREKPKKKWTLAEFNSTKEEALTYIEILQKAYKKIQSEEEKYSDIVKVLESKCARDTSLAFSHEKEHHKKKEDKKKHYHGSAKNKKPAPPPVAPPPMPVASAPARGKQNKKWRGGKKHVGKP